MRKTTVLTLFIIWTAVSFAQTANFTAATTSGCSPLVVNFQNQSTGATSYFWDFGNGATSTLQNPSTTYFKPGKYTVKLTATNAQSSNTLTRTQYIVVWGKPSVNFTVSDSAACFPHRAQFKDLSSASPETVNTDWLWDFGDGTQSVQQNPLNIYTASGNYTVTLKVTNDKGCYTAFTKSAYIKIAGGVQTSFTQTQPTVCRPPFDISFNNTSTGPNVLTWFWKFGDGQTSTQKNPTHTYTSPGNYSISLATTSSGGCSDTLVKDTALKILNISTSFNAPDSACINDPVQFTNNSTPRPNSVIWNFGDGTTAISLDASHTYSTSYPYKVTLYNTYAYCTDSFSKNIKTLPKPLARFTSDVRFKCQPSLTVNFQDQSVNAVGWFWVFGDGTTSKQQNPTHTYTDYGDYNVWLVVTNTSGCTDTSKQDSYVRIKRPRIILNPLPITGCIPFDVTMSPAITTLDAVTSYLWDFGDGQTSNLAVPSHTYLDQGTYRVMLTITTSTGCTESAAVNEGVKVGRHTIVDFDAAPKPVCAFVPVNFQNLTDTVADHWIWVFGDGTSSPDYNPVHQYSDTGWMNVTLYANNHGCLDSAIKNHFIQIKPPVARFAFKLNCDIPTRLEFDFKDSSLYDPSLGNLTWTWNFGDGTPVVTTQNVTHIFPGYGTYNVSLTLTNGSCQNTFTQEIKVFNIGLGINATIVSQCKVGNVQAFSVVQNPSNIVSYVWNSGNNQSGFDPNAGFLYNQSGDYVMSLVTTDIYGCKDTATKSFRINGPTANFTAVNPTGCKGLTTTFNDASKDDGVNKIVKWTWDFGDQSPPADSTAIIQHSYNKLGSYTVKLTVQDALGCIDSISKSDFVVTSNPKAKFYTPDSLSCPGSNVRFVNTSEASNYSSHWDFGDNTTSSLNSPVTTYSNTGLYTIKLTITDQYGCSDSMTKKDSVKINRPISAFTMKDSVSSCIPFEVDFINHSQYYQGFIWDLAGGYSPVTNPIQFYNKPGTYKIQLIAVSPGECRDTSYGTVVVYDTTGSRINYIPLNGCKPFNVHLNAISPGPMSYTWDFGDGVLVQNDTIRVDHVYNSFGNFVPKAIMADPSGCITAVTGIDTIHIKGANVKFGANTKLLCDSGFVQFSDSTVYNDSVSVYNWNFGDGAISHLQNPVHRYTSPGIYDVLLNVQTQSACVDTFHLKEPVKVAESPLISIGGDSVICVNELMQHVGVFDRPDTSVVKWAWQFPNGNISIDQNPAKQQYTKAGNFVVHAIASNSSGCRDTANKNILVNPLPVITMPSTMTMQAGFPVSIPATYSSNVVSYAWQPEATLSCSNCAQPQASPKFNTVYTVSVVDSNGCRNDAQVQVIVICKNANVFVPNTFSPNGDGVNDVFYVRGKGLDRVKSLRIFNRWGEVVYEQSNFPVNDPTYGWDGKFKGNKPVPDVYIYQVEVFCENSEIIHFEGNVALIQ
ncbi:MAG: PKD domain-containing protein [Flavisolibacter sp.]